MSKFGEKFIEKLHIIDTDREGLIRKYLMDTGWKHTSSTPGCYWMWCKKVDDVTYMVEEYMAVKIQHWLEQR